MDSDERTLTLAGRVDEPLLKSGNADDDGVVEGWRCLCLLFGIVVLRR